MFSARAKALAGASALTLLFGSVSFAGDGVAIFPVPPAPSPQAVDEAAYALGNPLNKPITGAAQVPGVIGGERPPSIETLQAVRAGGVGTDLGLEPGRAEILHQAGLTFGAQGGLSARSFGINEMLRRYEALLDDAYDFRSLVLPLGHGQTLMRPPIVTEAQMAFALGENAQVARETACIYQITREAQLASAPPNWRAYLVRNWGWPQRPSDAVLPRTEQEAAYWDKFVAEGWAQGEKQAVEIFLSDLGRLQREIVGMARYRVLLRAGLVEHPKVVFQNSVVNGGGGELRAGDRIVRITEQRGLQADRRSWPKGARDCPK
ncbi:type IV secretion system DotC family protein (plasmid) [Methylocapsa polymorpha]|uniref:Type IV secretion system DotC family protein n=1 Tax=Methylocapsa polymorpha TaxID=3080828 RepID=A0ABZ0HYG2_9HYPH|nr:type IV secretion system DotC family protein [Methylocapsa sp. RX1]WOJ91773.1 type IV secretion system DotC family protein [Methylocapsa sp. RX1]